MWCGMGNKHYERIWNNEVTFPLHFSSSDRIICCKWIVINENTANTMTLVFDQGSTTL